MGKQGLNMIKVKVNHVAKEECKQKNKMYFCWQF